MGRKVQILDNSSITGILAKDIDTNKSELAIECYFSAEG